jgi:hypothetical protein
MFASKYRIDPPASNSQIVLIRVGYVLSQFSMDNPATRSNSIVNESPGGVEYSWAERMVPLAAPSAGTNTDTDAAAL